MIATIHQPEHLPWLGYFHKMALADCYIYLDSTQYRHQYYQNRNRIIGVQAPLWVTVPVQKRCERYGPINELFVDNSHPWRKKYWRSIEYNYQRHPYFEAYAPEVREIIEAPGDRLVDLNYQLIDFFRRALGITTPLMRASEFKAEGFKTDLIHDLCLKVGATVYLSGPSGRDYLDEAPLRASGLDVWYHDFYHPVYEQRGDKPFQSHLAALDLLMNHGPASRRILLLDEIETERERLRSMAARTALGLHTPV